jgi:glycosyltransferase involved in cell wall biosynthesis
MKILLLNTSEQTGGAAVAANRLLSALRKEGIEAFMLVRDKNTKNPYVITVNTSRFKRVINYFRFFRERLVIFLCNNCNRKALFQVSIANTGTDISEHPLVKEADVIHLHWINQGFLSLRGINKLLKSGKRIVWTMHDMWPCTGICHHAWGCNGFMERCGICPFLMSTGKNDLSYRVLQKKRFLSESTVQVVTVGSWLKDLASKSIITGKLNISVIPNAIDTSVFSPLNKQEMRNKYSFPQTKKIILMGAAKINDPIKGFEYLRESLLLLKKRRDDLFLILFGEVKNDSSFLSGIPVDYAFMGQISDSSLIARLYASADVTVVPSYYETFGQTLVESMACGCPAVSFDNSGQTDIIEHKINGYLAKYKDAEDLAAGIEWVLENTEKLRLADTCIEKVRENYSESVVAGKYINLYRNLLL